MDEEKAAERVEPPLLRYFRSVHCGHRTCIAWGLLDGDASRSEGMHTRNSACATAARRTTTEVQDTLKCRELQDRLKRSSARARVFGVAWRGAKAGGWEGTAYI